LRKDFRQSYLIFGLLLSIAFRRGVFTTVHQTGAKQVAVCRRGNSGRTFNGPVCRCPAIKWVARPAGRWEAGFSQYTTSR